MYERRVRGFFETVMLPVGISSVILMICLLLSFRNLIHREMLVPAAITVCALIFVFALVAWVLLGAAARLTAVHSRYTYIEIGLRDVIVSSYAGQYVHFGERVVFRDLFIIPLDMLEEVGEVSVRGRKKIQFVGKSDAFRGYNGNSQRLGYIFVDGVLKFTEPYYELGGGVKCDRVVIPSRFGNVSRLVKSIDDAKKRLAELPPDKPYVFREMPDVREKRIRENINKLRNF